MKSKKPKINFMKTKRAKTEVVPEYNYVCIFPHQIKEDASNRQLEFCKIVKRTSFAIMVEFTDGTQASFHEVWIVPR